MLYHSCVFGNVLNGEFLTIRNFKIGILQKNNDKEYNSFNYLKLRFSSFHMLYDTNKLKTSAYYISQYFWIVYFLIPIILTFIFPLKTDKIRILSSNEIFDTSKNPVVFAHLSDTHINYLNQDSIESFRKVISIINSYSPEFIVLTGDIVDNYDSTSFPRYGDQFEENWNIYQHEISNISNIPIVEVGGNHDMFGIKSVLSQKNYMIDYSRAFNRSNTLSEKDFLVHSFLVGRSKTNVIAVNPYEFPSPHPPLLFFMQYSTQTLDLLSSEIRKSPSKSIVISHYPIGTMHSKRSSAGFKFSEIIGSQSSVLAYLTGHTHPKNLDVLHHGKGNLEIIGPASFQRSKFGMVTIDNNAISWSTIDITNPPNGIIAYPIPKEQISPHTIFNDIEHSEIRVIIFSKSKDLRINFSITNMLNSKTKKNPIFSDSLKYSRDLLKGRQVLYTFPLKNCISDHGTYKITFSGDFNGSTEFCYEDVISTGKEMLPSFQKTREIIFVTFPFFLLILLMVTFVFPFNCQVLVFDNIEEWIETSNGSNHWYFTFLLGFLLIRTRFQRSPKLIKLFVFLSVLLSFIGPILLFQTEDQIGLISVYGYYINSKAYSADYGTFYAYFYLLLVCFPMVILCSSFGVKHWSKPLIGDLVFTFVAFLGDIVVLIRLVYESVGPTLTVTSIGFVCVPFIFFTMITIWCIFHKGKEICCKRREGIADITDPSLSFHLTSNTNYSLE